MNTKTDRHFSLTNGPHSGVLKIAIGNLTLSVTTINNRHEAVVFSESGDTVSQKNGITDFMEVVHIMWNLERLSGDE